MDLILPTAPRLVFSPLAHDDAPFIVALLNDADFRRYIGDRGVREVGDVAAYLQAGPLRSYAEHRFGLLKLTQQSSGQPVGIAGLLKRPALDDVDLGYALLPGYRGRGYATEACRALIEMAASTLRLRRLVAIVTPQNARSIATLERVQFVREGQVCLPGDSQPVELYARHLSLPPDAAR
jgi:ribosomal-protein-alanine N-acetyltransferase